MVRIVNNYCFKERGTIVLRKRAKVKVYTKIFFFGFFVCFKRKKKEKRTERTKERNLDLNGINYFVLFIKTPDRN